MSVDTKTALLNSAERAARTRGFDGFSYADLAADVGIRKASIHHHFPSKAALSVALIERYYADLETACGEIDRDHTTGGTRLLAFIDRYRGALDGGHSLCLCVSFSTSTESLPDEVIIQMSRFRSMVLQWLTATFKFGKEDGTIKNVSNPELEAATALPLLEGAQLAARVEQDPQKFDFALQLLMNRLHQGQEPLISV